MPPADWQTPEQKKWQRAFEARQLRMLRELTVALAGTARAWSDCQPACRRAKTCMKITDTKLRSLTAAQRAAISRTGLPACLATARDGADAETGGETGEQASEAAMDACLAELRAALIRD